MKVEAFIEQSVEVEISLLNIAEELGSRMENCSSDREAMQLLNISHKLLSFVQTKHIESLDPRIRNHVAEQMQVQADRWRVKQ